MLLGLGDTLKALNGRLDADAGGRRSRSPIRKLVVEGVAEATRILREKADETNVRLSSMTQELQSLRQTVASMPPAGRQPARAGRSAAAGTRPQRQPHRPLSAGHRLRRRTFHRR